MGIGDFEPPGAPGGPPLGLRAKFGLVSDPGGLANDVFKAKNLIQIFSRENACFPQSWPVKGGLISEFGCFPKHKCLITILNFST